MSKQQAALEQAIARARDALAAWGCDPDDPAGLALAQSVREVIDLLEATQS